MFKMFKDTMKDDQTLAMPLEIESSYWDGTVRRFLGILCVFIIFLLTLSVFTPVREVALADGEIIPIGSVVPVEHFEGGIVDTVYVGEGGLVSKGDLLVKLRAESGSGDFKQIKVRRDLLEIRKVRLEAHLTQTKPDFRDISKNYADEIRDQLKFFKTEKEALKTSRQVLKSRLSQRMSDLAARQNELLVVEEQINIYEEQLEAQNKLLQKGYSSRSRLLQAKARLEEVKVSKAQLVGAIDVAKGTIEEIKNEMEQALAEKKQEWSTELVSTLAEISELEERLKSAKDRVNRLDVYAPKTGLVQALSATLPGQVIQPGDIVAEIVPVESSIEAEVRIQPKDIGYVQIGQLAEITLSTFDPEVFGKVEGTVRSLSPTTFETQQGEKYFKGLVTLDRSILEHNGRTFPITPGMIVSASVVTGSKSVMKYILKPVARSYDRAFSER